MLTQVEVRNAAGTLLTLVLDDVSDGYVLKDVEGLDPVKATIAFSSFANLDGVQFQNAKREARNLIFKFGFEPDFVTTTARGLRNGLYKWFMPKTSVSMRFFDSEGPTVEIAGRVEDFAAPPFSKEPGADVFVFCEDPDFVELTPISDSGDTVSDTTEFLVTYDGTTETGIEFTLNVDRDLSAFTVYHRQPDNIIKVFDVELDLEDLDVVKINTNVGHKSLTLTRSAVESSALYGLSNESDWFSMQQGDNYFRFYATGAAIPFTYQYTNRYGGL